jgi:regulator of ribonuclease activity A
VIYGCIRDIDEIRATDIGVQALGVHPMKTQKKGVGKINMPITFGGLTFKPGDYLYADNNGIIVSSSPLN